MRKKLGKRERESKKRRRRGRVSGTSTGGVTLKLGSKKMGIFFSKTLFGTHTVQNATITAKIIVAVVDAESMAKTCAGDHP